jgi:rhodanese-related sulfurtransferase
MEARIMTRSVFTAMVVAMMLVGLAGCAGTGSSEKTSGEYPSLTSPQLHERMAKGEKFVIVDVREEYEYSLAHIPDAVWLPRSKFDKGDPETLAKLKDIKPDSRLAVYCNASYRSPYATLQLRRMGYDAYNVDGFRVWRKAGYPIIEGPKLPPNELPLEIALEEAYENYYLKFKDVLWVDARAAHAYEKSHIKRAINVPLSKLEDSLAKIPRTADVVLYCEHPECPASTNAGVILLKHGYPHNNIRVFKGGIRAWKVAGYPVSALPSH